MKTPSIILCVLGCVCALGCRLDPRITMLEQESRMNEDKAYYFEDQYAMAQNALNREKQKNAELRAQLECADSTGSSQSTGSHLETPPSVNVKLPGSGTTELSPDDFENKSISPPSPGVTDPNARPPLNTPSAPSYQPEGASPSGDGEPIAPGQPEDKNTQIKDGKVLYREEGPRLRGDSRSVKSITISDMMTGGVNADGQKGNEGIFIVVEPRDAQGHLIPAVGPISIVAMDLALPKEKAKVARWDFTEDELSSQFRRSGSAEGFHLEVRWPKMPPSHEHLKLFVRYLTADSRILYAEVPIRVALTPKPSTIVARPEPRRADTARSDGWASRPHSSAPVSDPSPRVASLPVRPITQSIPPADEKPVYTRQPTPRPRPTWTPER